MIKERNTDVKVLSALDYRNRENPSHMVDDRDQLCVLSLRVRIRSMGVLYYLFLFKDGSGRFEVSPLAECSLKKERIARKRLFKHFKLEGLVDGIFCEQRDRFVYFEGEKLKQSYVAWWIE